MTGGTAQLRAVAFAVPDPREVAARRGRHDSTVRAEGVVDPTDPDGNPFRLVAPTR